MPNSHGGVNGHSIVGWNYFLELAANDYIEIWWSATSTAVSLQFIPAQTSPTRPSTASLITTMNFVSFNSLTNIYASSLGQGTATINHFANSTANKTYKYVVIG